MKITQDHYSKLKEQLFICIKNHKLHPFMVKTNARAWEVFHAAKVDWIYDHYNDSNINVALNKMFK